MLQRFQKDKARVAHLFSCVRARPSGEAASGSALGAGSLRPRVASSTKRFILAFSCNCGVPSLIMLGFLFVFVGPCFGFKKLWEIAVEEEEEEALWRSKVI